MPPPDGHIAAPEEDPPPGGSAPLANAFLSERAGLLAALTRRFGATEADDLAQETFLRLYGYAPPSGLRSPKAFFLRIALNLAANRFKRAQRELPIAANDDLLELLQTLPPGEQAVFFRQMMLAMPPKLRDVFLLNRIKGLTFQQVADRKGISVKTVEKHMAQAIVLCTKALRS